MKPLSELTDPFSLSHIDISISKSDHHKTLSGDTTCREVKCAAKMTAKTADTVVHSELSNELFLGPVSDSDAKFYVRRRTVSGTRHRGICISWPYLYCQASICSNENVCGPWKYEHDGPCYSG